MDDFARQTYPVFDTRLAGEGQAMLAVSRQGGGDKGNVLLAHGFGQTRRAWNGAARALADAGFITLSYDARGHGQSSRNPPGLPYDAAQFTDDMIALAGGMSPPPVLVGASMGGLFGLLAQARQPGLFSAMVLVDITPRWEAAGTERILNFMRAHPRGFDSLDAAAAAIAAYLPHRQRKPSDGLRKLLNMGEDGRWRWHWDPRLLDELVSGDPTVQHDLFMNAARQVHCPLLLISGGRSDLVTPQTVAEFLALVPHAAHVQLPEATHMVAGDENDAFTSTVLNYLSALPTARAASASRTHCMPVTETANGTGS